MSNSKGVPAIMFIVAMTAVLLGVLAFSNPFIFDDDMHFLSADYLFQWPSDLSFLRMKSWTYRPVISASYLLDYFIFGFKAGPMRMINVLIHLLNIFLIWRIFYRQMSLQDQWRLTMALMSVVFFSFHPIVWHSIIYVSARSTLLATTFILLSVIQYRREGRKRWIFLIYSLLAVATKEIGFLSLPLVVLLNWDLARQDWKNVLGKPYGRLAISLFGALLMAFTVVTKQRLLLVFYDTLFGERHNPHHYGDYILTEFKVVMDYISLWLFPSNWQFTYDPGLQRVGQLTSWIYLLRYFAFFGSVGFLLRKEKASLLLFTSIVICFLPEQFYPRNILGQDQRCYLPFLLSGPLIWQLLSPVKKRSWQLFVVSIFSLNILANSWILIGRINTYRVERNIYERDVSMQPLHMLAWSILAQIYLDEGKFAPLRPAVENLLVQKSQDISRSYFTKTTIQKLLGILMDDSLANNDQVKVGQLIEYCQSNKMHPDVCHYHQSRLFRRQGNFAEAIAELEKIKNKTSILLQTEYMMNYKNLGQGEMAMEIGKKLLDEHPENNTVAMSLIYLYRDLKKNDLALQLIAATLSRLQSTNSNQSLQKKLSGLQTDIQNGNIEN